MDTKHFTIQCPECGKKNFHTHRNGFCTCPCGADFNISEARVPRDDTKIMIKVGDIVKFKDIPSPNMKVSGIERHKVNGYYFMPSMGSGSYDYDDGSFDVTCFWFSESGEPFTLSFHESKLEIIQSQEKESL